MANKIISDDSYVIVIGDTFFAEDNIEDYANINNFKVTKRWDFARRFNSLPYAKKALEGLCTGSIAKVSFTNIEDLGE